jgi:hypothetical protein
MEGVGNESRDSQNRMNQIQTNPVYIQNAMRATLSQVSSDISQLFPHRKMQIPNVEEKQQEGEDNVISSERKRRYLIFFFQFSSNQRSSQT